MTAIKSPKVLVLAENPRTGSRWADWLAGTAEQVYRSAAEVGPDTQIDVIVTDLVSSEALFQRLADAVPCVGEGRMPLETGVVGIGRAAWAEVHLPDDCTPRELCLACTLHVEIMRLRGQCDRMARTGRQIRELAYTDPLTLLPNRRAWDVDFEIKRRALEDNGTPFCLAIVDLDRFKEVNESQGLSVGDQVLKIAAEALAHAVRHDDLVARLGGDEFGVLLWGLGEPEALGVLERLRAAVATTAGGGASAAIAASVGYALASTPGAVAELFVMAERGLRRAKAAGGNRVCRGDDPTT